MAINVFYNIEHYTMPQIFYCEKPIFLWVLLIIKVFCIKHSILFFEMAFQKGVIKKKRKFKAGDFKISEKRYDDKHKLLCIHLPKPKTCDHSDVYLRIYFISFLECDNKIEVLDIYGLQKRNSKQNENFVVSFVDGNDDEIVFRGIVKDDLNSIFEYMYKVAFENFYPRVTLSCWDDLT